MPRSKANRPRNLIAFPPHELTIRARVTQDEDRAPVLQRYDAWRGVEVIGDWFALSRHGRRARCEIRTHPLGWDLRLVGAARDGFEMMQVCKTEQEVFDTGDEWKAKMVAKGWRLAADPS